MSAEYLDDDDFDPRESRLQAEFAEMQELRRPDSLIDFACARMNQGELDEWLKPSFSLDNVRDLARYLSVEEFQQRFPGVAPDKYVVRFSCRGIARRPQDPATLLGWLDDAQPKAPGDDELVEVDEHELEIILGLDYPEEAPRLVWLTPIFHPNIRRPYLCTTGRPFAPGTRLKSICLMAGQMVQYRHYNLDSVMDYDARAWTEETRRHNPRRLPLDDRDLLTGRVEAPHLVEVLDRGGGAAPGPGAPVIEWT
jgi:hypothetical protein